jgi:hypothetical protein
LEKLTGKHGASEKTVRRASALAQAIDSDAAHELIPDLPLVQASNGSQLNNLLRIFKMIMQVLQKA